MEFAKHYNLEGCHATFSPSTPYWLGYDDERTKAFLRNKHAKEHGTRVHEYARQAITLGIKQRKSVDTLCQYVNDAIGYRMTPEVCLYYSPTIFGHADSISFDNNLLRIHDLKTGKERGNMKQLMVYAALFCLEYGYSPYEIQMELRIYQYDKIETCIPEAADIRSIMDNIIRKNQLAEQTDL